MILQHEDRFGQGHKMYVEGMGEIYLHFEMTALLGDTLGHDAMCCHMQAYSSPVERPMRNCTLPWHELDNPIAKCTRVTQAGMQKNIEKCIDKITRKRKRTHYREKNQRNFATPSQAGVLWFILGGIPLRCVWRNTF